MDLGSKPWQVFKDITLPLSMPGIIAGGLLVFIPATGEYVIPALLGNPSNPMIGRVLFDEFFSNRDWPVASAVAVVLLVALVAPIMFFQYYQGKEAEAGK
jgi:putrescine transport system permease protein